MLSPGKALVGGKDDYGVFQLVGFFSEAAEHRTRLHRPGTVNAR